MINIADKTVNLLREWASRYLRNRDIILRNIEDIKENEDSIDIKYKNKQMIYFTVPFLNDDKFKKTLPELQKDQHVGLFVFNTKDNLDFIVKHWNEIIKNPKLILYFFNPFSKTDKIWSIYPSTHHYISEGKGLKLGLQSLAANVEETTEDYIDKIAESE